MVKIILIRPGSTDYDRQGRIQGTLDVPLNEQGSAEVTRLIEDLRDVKLEAVYAPAGQPALATAEAIAEAFDVKCRKLDRMHNLDHGLWQGMLIDDVRLRQPKVYRQWQERPQCICPPEGEMLDHAAQRVRTAMSKLLKRHKNGVIGLVVPEPLASLVRRLFNHGELGNLWKAASGHGRWEVLDVQPTALAHSG
ncbi:MAG: histidine phosphatase family protein [Planctomycetota bacterium]|jgi:probable phosphoglycerate mutase